MDNKSNRQTLCLSNSDQFRSDPCFNCSLYDHKVKKINHFLLAALQQAAVGTVISVGWQKKYDAHISQLNSFLWKALYIGPHIYNNGQNMCNLLWMSCFKMIVSYIGASECLHWWIKRQHSAWSKQCNKKKDAHRLNKVLYNNRRWCVWERL